jgi:plastocyanin
MRRWFTLPTVLFALALTVSACSTAKDTGFPPIAAASSASASPSASVLTTPVTAATLIGKDIKWDLSQLLFKANEKVTVTVDNQDTALSVPHNFGIWTDKDRKANEIFKPSKDVAPGQKFDYVVPALKAGTYYFECDIHPSMNGTVTVK